MYLGIEIASVVVATPNFADQRGRREITNDWSTH